MTQKFISLYFCYVCFSAILFFFFDILFISKDKIVCINLQKPHVEDSFRFLKCKLYEKIETNFCVLIRIEYYSQYLFLHRNCDLSLISKINFQKSQVKDLSKKTKFLNFLNWIWKYLKHCSGIFNGSGGHSLHLERALGLNYSNPCKFP